jgi:putative transposase
MRDGRQPSSPAADTIEQARYYQAVNSERTQHATYDVNYHVVWCPEYRRAVLSRNVGERLEELKREKTAELEGKVLDLTIQPNPVHLFGSFPPTIASYQMVHRIKSYAAHVLREGFARLKGRLPCMTTPSYYVGPAGHVSSETIMRYIEAQKGR